MTILEEITQRKRRDLEEVMQKRPLKALQVEVERLLAENPSQRSLPQAITQVATAQGVGIIAEFKRKSPSLGWIKEEAKPEEVVTGYAVNGAAAVSILTDTPYFGGNNGFIEGARPLINIPILRKDFIISEYQLFEAKKIGADAILLIAACLGRPTCKALAHLAKELQLNTLLEIHEESELDYIGDNIDVVGVNNRNLHLFKTDIATSLRLFSRLPKDKVKISESGLHSVEDVSLLQSIGYQGFLMGERFMKTANPPKALKEFIDDYKGLRPKRG